jgi:hypothetical protein
MFEIVKNHTTPGLPSSREKIAKFVNSMENNCSMGHHVMGPREEGPPGAVITSDLSMNCESGGPLSHAVLWPLACCEHFRRLQGDGRRRCAIGAERRRFQRLPLPIPLFLRGVDGDGQDFLDFTLALNVSGGGALVATRRSLPRASRLCLEMPTAPVPPFHIPLQPNRALSGRVVRSVDKDTYYLCAVRFARPLI